MQNYSLFKRISSEFLNDLMIIDSQQSFLVGIICGFYLQHKREDMIEVLKQQLGFIKMIINSGLSNGNLFDDSILNLISNLEAPEIFEAQNHYQQIEKKEKIRTDFQNSFDDNDETIELIKKLQAEDEETSKMFHKQMEEEQVDCPICLTPLMDDDVYPLENCIHAFHLSCLKKYIDGTIAERRREILCPIGSCKIQLAVQDIGYVAGPAKQHEFEEYTFNQFVDFNAVDMSWCPTPDCKFAFVFDEIDRNKEFVCKLCKKHYCLNCRVPYHQGQSCKEYQITNTRDKNDIKFENFVRGHKFKMCSKCKFWVEKDQGCNHMTCRCGYEFCYACGGKFQQCECPRLLRESIERLAPGGGPRGGPRYGPRDGPRDAPRGGPRGEPRGGPRGGPRGVARGGIRIEIAGGGRGRGTGQGIGIGPGPGRGEARGILRKY